MTELNGLGAQIGRQIAAASCLPFEAYRSGELFQAERARVFHASWIPVCTATELTRAGDYLSRTIGGEPIVVVRGEDGQLRALSNICRHRGTPLTDAGRGNVTKFVCPYHAWSYDHQGTLRGVPYPGDQEIDRSRHGLDTFALEIWNNVVFVNLDRQAVPLATRLQGLERFLERTELSRYTVTAGVSQPMLWKANWKLIIENAMESYHLFQSHKHTLEPLAPTRDAFYLEGGSDWTVTAGKYTAPESPAPFDPPAYSDFERNHYILISIPPAFVCTISQRRFGWLSVEPISERESLVWTTSAAPVGTKITTERSELNAAFIKEDHELCERAQRGMESEHSCGGAFVSLERVITDFHSYVAGQLFDHAPRTRWSAPLADQLFPSQPALKPAK